MDNIIDIRQLSKSYSSGMLALSDITVSLPKGRIIGLLGTNGSGKSTLFKLISGLLSPTSGEIFIDGKPVGPETKKIVSFLPERNHLNNELSPAELIDFFQDFYEDFDKNVALYMLNDLKVNINAKLKTFSKGTKEKVQLVLVMSRRAKLYLLDEPIGGVDPAARDYILNTIISNYNRESTLIISTHLIRDIEPFLDDFIFINYGRIDIYDSVANTVSRRGMSLDELFRDFYRMAY